MQNKLVGVKKRNTNAKPGMQNLTLPSPIWFDQFPMILGSERLTSRITIGFLLRARDNSKHLSNRFNHNTAGLLDGRVLPPLCYIDLAF